MTLSKRISLGIEYEGTNYFGFQKQKTTTQTIQGNLEKAISEIADHKSKVFCCGRTDRGVHALNQVIHFDTFSERENHEWLRGVNSLLPSDIRVKWVKEVDNNFHARFSATSRTYRYIINNSGEESALWSNRSLWIKDRLYLQKMRDASKYLIGENDFSSFRGSGCQSSSAIRFLETLSISKENNFIIFEITANSFLLHMVRIIIGTLLKVGRKEITAEKVKSIMFSKDRKQSGKTVSPKGLYLISADYEDCFDIPKKIDTKIL
tara:strand:- start:11374 stop:12165 length:792 start_codon:yes stop_codon:yes gene_type:complete